MVFRTQTSQAPEQQQLRVWIDTERCRLLVVRRVSAAALSAGGHLATLSHWSVAHHWLSVCVGIHCEMGFQTPSWTFHGSLAHLIKIMFRTVAQTRYLLPKVLNSLSEQLNYCYHVRLIIAICCK